MKTTAYRIIVTALFFMALPYEVNATDCNSDCRKSCTTSVAYPCGGIRFRKCHKEVLDPLCNARCNAEREASCRFGVEHCDFHSRDLNIAVDIIQQAHNKKNDPKTVHQCYQYIDNGSLAHSVGGGIYNYINNISSNFNPYAYMAKEITKQIARCACKKVEWKSR